MIKLFYTDALPQHYVAEDESGKLWMIPCAPMSPEVWNQKKTYHGNYILHPVRPEGITRFYDPAQITEKRERTIRLRVTASEGESLDTAAAESGRTLSQYIRSKLGI